MSDKLTTKNLIEKYKISETFFIDLLSENKIINKEENGFRLTNEGKIFFKGKIPNGKSKLIIWDNKILDFLDEKLNLNSGNSEGVSKEDNLNTVDNKEQNCTPSLTAKKIADELGVSPKVVNSTFGELGLLKRIDGGGWVVTDYGKSLGGVNDIYMGNSFAKWDKSILENKKIITAFKKSPNKSSEKKSSKIKITDNVIDLDYLTQPNDFRSKFPAEFRTSDGHYVRSRAEVMIDNWLYTNNIAHAYERKLPIEEDLYCDFYIPLGKVYIEYWGLEGSSSYDVRKKQKLDIYEKYNLSLIEVGDTDLLNLDDILPAKLLKHGINLD